jgi:hypothetical protein
LALLFLFIKNIKYSLCGELFLPYQWPFSSSTGKQQRNP